MRVLHVISSLAPELGGPSAACIAMARAVAARGHAVEIFTTDYGGRVEDPAVPVRYGRVQWPQAIKTSWELKAALDRETARFDVVHLHSLYLFHDWAAPRACRRAGVPYIVRPHGTLDPYIRRRRRLAKTMMNLAFQNRVLRGAAAIHYTSAEEMRLAAPHVHGARGVVVPLGFDVETFARLPGPEPFLAHLRAARGKRVVLFLSRVHEKKGLDLLIPAFARVARDRPGLYLAIVGPDGGMAARARRWIGENGLGDRASVVGMVQGELKLSAFSAASVFALPSYSENFGIVALEAMAAGVPLAISDQVNIWRETEGAGLVCQTTVDSVAECLARILDDPNARAMGEAGRRIARARFAWPNIAVELERLYEDVRSSR
jgi:glycosyltransferase involved in cell wall biosynthesis